MGGSGTLSNNVGQPGVYGTLGTPTAGNIPGGRDSAVTWTDNNGDLWLFGGEGADANGNFGQLNDLWEFQPSTQEWTWTGGNKTVPASCAGSTTVACGQPGVYGMLGTPAPGNIPGGRDGAAAWADSSGDFWIFGGFGFDADGNLGELNDLWEFNPTSKEWAWMGGNSTTGSNGGQSGIYGTQGNPSKANAPGGRDSATTWVDENGNLWLFGGEGFDDQGNDFQLNDLWEFNPSTNEWTWINGSSTVPGSCSATPYGVCGQTVIYGQLGTASPSANPGARVSASAWTDNNGDLWLFGGLGVVPNDTTYLNIALYDQYDLWKFSPSTNEWAWMAGNSTAICRHASGSSTACEYGVYGTAGTPSRIIPAVETPQSVGLARAGTSGYLEEQSRIPQIPRALFLSMTTGFFFSPLRNGHGWEEEISAAHSYIPEHTAHGEPLGRLLRRIRLPGDGRRRPGRIIKATFGSLEALLELEPLLVLTVAISMTSGYTSRQHLLLNLPLPYRLRRIQSM